MSRPRLRSCIEAWPECATGEYNPSCCRFPKSCSCTVYEEGNVTASDLEQPQALSEPEEVEGEREEILASFKLHPEQLETVRAAIAETGEGFWRVALDCRRISGGLGNTGAGLLMHRLKRGDHYDELLALQAARPKLTGWRRVRGSHGETWLQDPAGTDPLPRDYYA